jgi:hypothetical protein
MRHLLVPALSLVLGSSLIAQTASPIDAKSMLAGLQEIKQKQADTSKHELAQTILDFTTASGDDGSALAFYEEAERVTRFVGRQDADTAFEAWKKTAVPRLNPVAIRAALRYTTISLQRAAGGTDDQIFPVLLAYADDAQAALASVSAQDAQDAAGAQQGGGGFGRRGRNGFGGGAGGGGGEGEAADRIMEEDVSQNVFARWYNLSSQLSGLADWEMVPANIDGMYIQFLLPYMRKNRDPRVLTYWDNKIISDRGMASSASAAFNTDRYNLTTRPSLLWSRAEDEIVIGRRDQGITDMYALVKAFPGHPDAGKWIAELQGLLTTPPTVAAGGTAPATPH